MKPELMVADAISPKGMDALLKDERWDVVDGSSWDRDTMLTKLSQTELMIVRSSTKVDNELMDAAPKLRILVRAGTGVDNIDVAYAHQKDITVMNTPGTNAQAAAELAMGLMLTMFRQLDRAMLSVREGKWDRKAFVGRELHRKTLGIIGLGNIGSRVATIAHGFGMNILGFDPRHKGAALDAFSVQAVSQEELLQNSDVVTLHAALNDKTRHMVNATFLNQMKEGAFLINCARAELIDEKAALIALDQERLAGLATDVLSQEPPELNDPLVAHARVWVTPHIGASTQEAQDNVMVQVIEQLQKAIDFGEVTHPVVAL